VPHRRVTGHGVASRPHPPLLLVRVNQGKPPRRGQATDRHLDGNQSINRSIILFDGLAQWHRSRARQRSYLFFTVFIARILTLAVLSCFNALWYFNNNNNNPICKAPECQKTSVALGALTPHSSIRPSRPGPLNLVIPPSLGAMTTGVGFDQHRARNSEFCVTAGPVIGTAGS